MKLEDQNILIISNEPWGPFWYSKHNYANELSKKNNVFFLDPPLPFHPKNIFTKEIREKSISPTLTVLEYSNFYPVSLFKFWKLNDRAVLSLLKEYFRKKKISRILFWTFDPIRLAYPEILEPKKILLHVVDDYLFSYPSEEFLAKKADLIISVSEKIAVNYKNYNSNIHVIRHAIPDDEFLPADHGRNHPLKGIFIGKIDKRIDIGFNMEIFRSFPEVQFTIIGSAEPEFIESIRTSGLKNVTISPPIPSGELKLHVRNADFCFIFKKVYKGNNIFSHKLLQYLAQGKPVFSTDFSDMGPELKNAFYLSNDPEEIKKMLAGFIEKGEGPEKAATRIAYARQNTFSKAFTTIENLLA
jgi:hypothetical protein